MQVSKSAIAQQYSCAKAQLTTSHLTSREKHNCPKAHLPNAAWRNISERLGGPARSAWVKRRPKSHIRVQMRVPGHKARIRRSERHVPPMGSGAVQPARNASEGILGALWPNCPQPQEVGPLASERAACSSRRANGKDAGPSSVPGSYRPRSLPLPLQNPRLSAQRADSASGAAQ